jgi:hypothetical protein
MWFGSFVGLEREFQVPFIVSWASAEGLATSPIAAECQLSLKLRSASLQAAWLGTTL